MTTRFQIAIALLAAGLMAGSVAAGKDQRGQASAPRSVTVARAEPEAPSGWIGVWLVDEVDGGARIVALVPGGPAERASLRVGDIIVQANAQPVPRQDDLTNILRPLSPGASLDVLVIRAGENLQRSVAVAARPTRTAVRPTLFARPARRGLDLEVTEITPALREHYGAPPDAGVLVVRAEADGVGGRSGIRVGDVLVRVGEQMIVHPRQIQWLFWQPDPAEAPEALIVRKGKSKTVRLAPLETKGEEAQDGDVRRRLETEALTKRLKLELERLERRMDEIRSELSRLEADRRN